MDELAKIAHVDPEIFHHYDTGELKIDEDTLQRIYEFDNSIDWLWLEYGFEPEDIRAIDECEKLRVQYWC